MEWAIEVCKETGKAVAANMCIGPDGDMHGISAAECAIRYLLASNIRFIILKVLFHMYCV